MRERSSRIHKMEESIPRPLGDRAGSAENNVVCVARAYVRVCGWGGKRLATLTTCGVTLQTLAKSRPSSSSCCDVVREWYVKSNVTLVGPRPTARGLICEVMHSEQRSDLEVVRERQSSNSERCPLGSSGLSAVAECSVTSCIAHQAHQAHTFARDGPPATAGSRDRTQMCGQSAALPAVPVL